MTKSKNPENKKAEKAGKKQKEKSQGKAPGSAKKATAPSQ